MKYKLLTDTTIDGVFYAAGGVVTELQTKGQADYLIQVGAIAEIKQPTPSKKD